ncbi:MAG: hypothetical protein ABEJ23_01455 [Haloarculaceae archaeon]
MDSDVTPYEYGRRLGPHALAFALGLLAVGYAATTYWQYAYMAANPAVGRVSTSAAGALFHVALFLVGAMVAFTAAGTALYRILRDAGGSR